MPTHLKFAFLAFAAILAACAPMAGTPQDPMSFFVTSANPGNGADFKGLAGADAYCQARAAPVNAGGKNWRAPT